MRVVIIEDETFAALHLEKMLLNIDGNITVVAKLPSVEESIDWFLQNPEPDLILMDIHLEDGISFSIFDTVQPKSAIVFTTAYDDYALKAFKLKSVDYLLKPIMPEDLRKSIEKYKSWNATDESSRSSRVDLGELAKLMRVQSNHFRERFGITVGTKIRMFGINEVAYFYSEEGFTYLVTNEKHEYPLDDSLDELGNQLNPRDFFRINRQFLVKHKSIKEIHLYPKGRLRIELIPNTAKEVMVSIDKVTKFKAWLDS